MLLLVLLVALVAFVLTAYYFGWRPGAYAAAATFAAGVGRIGAARAEHAHAARAGKLVSSVVATRPVTEVVAVGTRKPKPKR